MSTTRQFGQHDTVLLHEAVEALMGPHDGVYIDGTFGRGGHSLAILEKLDQTGRLFAFDKDLQAIARAKEINDARFFIKHSSFVELEQTLLAENVAHVSGVLFDLGVSSPQIDDGQRGFSFRQDGPLDMRMDTTRGLTAAQWLASADENEMARVIREYGEERFAGQIAKALVARRQKTAELGPLERSAELATIVAQVVRTREKGQDPATRTFQAIRIFINQELDDLSRALDAALKVLELGGRLVVISFHSLEDRIVKKFMQTHAGKNISDIDANRRLPLREVDMPLPRLKIISRVRAGEAEVQANRRARSAVMRVAEKLR